MIRFFEQHKVRQQKELDDIWDFTREDGREYRLPVPGCWEQHPELLNFRGKGTYRRKIHLPKEANLRIEFKGVSHTADVYFDGVHIAHHYNAFTSFSGIVKNAAPGEHELRVEADNSFGEHSALHIPNDYYTYGGITRPVVLEEIGDVYVERLRFTPILIENQWQAKIEILVKNIGEKEENADFAVSLAGREFAVAVESLKPGEERLVSAEQDFPGVSPWSGKEPKLYFLSVRLMQEGRCVDDLIERVGFRQVELKGRKLCVNGEEVFLKGFNRHEDYGVIGCAIPPQLMAQDLDLMQDMGANAVRTCHYPNDERFLDLCDERGILVWEEKHARGLDLEKMQNPNFERQCRDCIREMIESHYNHPAIIIWGILNECASETPEGREMYAKQYGRIREMDTTRPVTSATCRHFTDICLDLPDIVSFNIYSGWYQDVPVKGRHEEEMDWIEQAGGKGKPVIVSEFGGAAIYGYRDRGRCKWSEERQADIIRENLEVYKSDERLSGVFIWQFADCRVTEEGGWAATRARCHNNKGVLDEYRRPKEAYDVVKEMYGQM